MKMLILFVGICFVLSDAKSFVGQPVVGTPFVIANPSQFTIPTSQYPISTSQVIPTFRVVGGVPAFPFVYNRFHTQDSNGAYTFSYSGGPSSRTESRDRFGNVVGSFNYVDPEGKIQTQQYVADSEGFRVAGTNLPVERVVKDTEKVKDVLVTRSKREATTINKTPASTKLLNTINDVVPQTYSTGFTSHIIPNSFVVSNNVIPNVYTPSQVPVTNLPFSVYHPTVYAVPRTVPVPTEITETAQTKVENTPIQPTVYTGVKTPIFTFNPNFFTTSHINTQKTPGTGFTYFY